MRDEPVYRGIVGFDIEGFSRAEWTDPIRARLRDRLHTLVDDALAHAEIDPALTVRSDTGDGLWLLADAQVPTTRLLHPLATTLASGLAADNRRMPAGEGMRLRVVVHAGELLHDSYGHTGQSFNHAARLLDAEAPRAMLAANPAATVVLIVSDVLYDGVVRHAYEGIGPDGWQPVRVHAKETSTRGWIHLPGLATQPRLPAMLAAPRVGQAGLPIPRELPRPPGDFTGRGEELASLWKLLRAGGSIARGAAPGSARPSGGRGRGGGRGRPLVVAAIDGMGGIGKSALALQLADQLAGAGAFPDGQLYVNLQGATPGLAPLAPLDALGRLLRSLGLDPAQIPDQAEEAAVRFRSLAAEQRLLILLDNAHDAEQVRPLLPASPTCRVLVTSRQVLATLDGAYQLHLDILPEPQALALLGRIAGPQRLDADPPAAAAVVRLCGSLPLAIRIAGARLAARPAWPARVLAERLADATGRLDELRAGELAVRASFDVSLHTLTESSDVADRTAAGAFGLLSLPDGPDLDVAAAARLLDQPEPTTQRLLERLVDAQLLDTPRPGRYQFHDLVRLHARQHATRQHPEPERLAALTRLVGFYTATAWHTITLRDPGSARGATADPRWTAGGLRFADDAAAMSWLEAERGNLLAAIGQAVQAAPGVPTELAGQLTRALWPLFETHGYCHDGIQANQTALALARHTGDRATQAHALNDLGCAYLWLRRYPESLPCLREALTLHRELGDRWGEALSLHRLGRVYGLLGRFTEAIACLQEALTLRRESGNRHDQANSADYLGRVYGQVGQYVEAIACLQESLTLSQELRNRWHHADSLQGLGIVYERIGHLEQAIACLRESHTMFGELRHRFGQADSLRGLGVVYRRVGRHVEAIASLQACIAIRRELGDHPGQAEALRDLGDALQVVAQHQLARAAWQEALTIYETLQLPEADELRGRLAAMSPGTAQPLSGR